ncbi:TetR/AcrR family transcriptional regulator [Agrobacterium fabrum]|uniref:TetR/AcrR family transcriptional regulator n=1 Tax=Agrobacterium fabrum TaxID=1176649 RepID=UPI001FED38EA|nr:TetR/AcrR family transcriptional regulator [Agrobacterium fabrum]
MEKFSNKEERVLTAAEDVFARYGFARTTMGDIAKAAAISRPALYLIFPDKEAIFTRVIEMMDARSLDLIQNEVDQIAAIDQKLLHACTIWGLHGVELATAYPDAADLFDFQFRPFVKFTNGFSSFSFEYWKKERLLGNCRCHVQTLRRRSPMVYEAFDTQRLTLIT